MNKYFNLTSLFLILPGTLVYLVLTFFWSDICISFDCSSYTMSGYLSPLRVAGLVIAVISAPFLILPTHYFKSWCKWVFAPAVVVTLLNLAIIDPNSSSMFRTTREQAMQNYLWVWLIITLLFIAYHYYKTKRLDN